MGRSREKALMFKGSDEKERWGGGGVEEKEERNDLSKVKEIGARCRLLYADNCASH